MKKILVSSRRDLIKLLGLSLIGSSCTSKLVLDGSFVGKSLPASLSDDITIAEGLYWRVLVSYGDKINPAGDFFGYNNDFLMAKHHRLNSKNQLWVNHEFITPKLMEDKSLSAAQNDEILKKSVGGSCFNVESKNGNWYVEKSIDNFRLDANTDIIFSGGIQINNKSSALGTFANCSGGKTSWGTYLTCEENYDSFVGEVEHLSAGNIVNTGASTNIGWESPSRPPEHYGWVVEIDPKTKSAKKLVSLGRFAHEGAKFTLDNNGFPVVYMGDDKSNQFLYKFISENKDSLEQGELFVADIDSGTWLSLDWGKSTILQSNFTDQIEVLIFARKAAMLIGASPLDRPEGIDVNPSNSDVLVCLTSSGTADGLHGQILKVIEEGGDHGAMKFDSETYYPGGPTTGFSHPDNIVFDPAGNLWFTTDVPSSAIGSAQYEEYGNNSLFVIPKKTGSIIRVATCPNDAEFCSPCFVENGHVMFLSVQHPGSRSSSLTDLTSHWPSGGTNIPKPAVIEIKGAFLSSLMN